MNLHIWSKKSISYNLANTVFLILFPGFFFYHFAVARGFMPPVLGGYFGVAAVFALLPLIFTYLKYQRSNYGSKVFLLFCLIVIYTTIVVACNYILDKPYGYSYDMVVWSVSGIIFNVVAFLIGGQMSFQNNHKVNIIFLVLMFIVVVLNVGEYGIFYVKQESDDGSDIATYQGFARSIVFVSLILTGIYIKNLKILIFILILSIAALLLNGSRTEFAAYVASSLIMFIFYGLKSPKGFIALIASMIALFFATSYLMELYPESRMLELSTLQESSSFDARYDLNKYGLSLILDDPLMGAYGMYVYLDGVGSYPHNLLSAWVNLGIFGFLFYLVLFFILIKAAFLGFDKNLNNVTYRVFLIFLIFTIITIVASKDYSYMAIGFLIGIFVNWRNLNIKERKKIDFDIYDGAFHPGKFFKRF